MAVPHTTSAVPGPTDEGTLAQPPEAHVPPIPPRFWWLKRLIAASVVLILALIALRIWWGREAQRRLGAAIDRYRAAGQPVLAEDFDAALDAVPDEENAAVLYQQAVEVMATSTADGRVTIRDFDDPSRFVTNPAAADELMKLNHRALELARAARARCQAAWSHRLSQVIDEVFGPMAPLRNFARILNFAAAHHHLRGDDRAAIETLDDLLALGEAIHAQPTLIDSLVGWAVYALGPAWIEEHLPTLRIARRGPVGPPEPGAVPRPAIKALIKRLLDETRFRDDMALTLLGERAYILATWDRPGSWAPYLPPLGGELRPYLALNVTEVCNRHTEHASMVQAGMPWPEVGRLWPSHESLIETVAHFPADLMSSDRAIFLYYRILADRRMAAIALAICLHKVDHGHRPAELAALVPDYLPEVPRDPFSPDGATFIYKPDAPRAMLYSLDGDGDDDGGRPRQRGGDHDWPFYLDPETEGPPPLITPAAPATRPGDDPPAQPRGDNRPPEPFR